MASNYYVLENYAQNGTIGISLASFEQVATIAADSVEDVTVQKKTFFLADPVKATRTKDGRVKLSLVVSVKKGAKVEPLCREIQEEVTNAIQMMCETVPVRVEIKVASVK
jgi:uncharacterized alkaline shock family protein YloU